MRTEAITLLVILGSTVLIFSIVGWMVVRVDRKLHQRSAGAVFRGQSGGDAHVAADVSCGDAGAGCGS